VYALALRRRWLHIVVIALQIACVVMYNIMIDQNLGLHLQSQYEVYEDLYSDANFFKLKQEENSNPESGLQYDLTGLRSLVRDYADVETLVQAQQRYFLLQSVSIGCLFLRLLGWLGAHKRLGIVSRTLAAGRQDLIHFFYILFVLQVGFVGTGIILFGDQMEEFASLLDAFHTVLYLSLGGNWDKLRVITYHMETALDPSPLYQLAVVVYYLSVIWMNFFIALNFVLAIIAEAHLYVKADGAGSLTLREDINFLSQWYVNGFRKSTRWFLVSDNMLQTLRITAKDDPVPVAARFTRQGSVGTNKTRLTRMASQGTFRRGRLTSSITLGRLTRNLTVVAAQSVEDKQHVKEQKDEMKLQQQRELQSIFSIYERKGNLNKALMILNHNYTRNEKGRFSNPCLKKESSRPGPHRVEEKRVAAIKQAEMEAGKEYLYREIFATFRRTCDQLDSEDRLKLKRLQAKWRTSGMTRTMRLISKQVDDLIEVNMIASRDMIQMQRKFSDLILRHVELSNR